MFRILITPAIFDTRETAHEAQALAMREAAMLSRDCGVTVECKVFRMAAQSGDVPRSSILGGEARGGPVRF